MWMNDEIVLVVNDVSFDVSIEIERNRLGGIGDWTYEVHLEGVDIAECLSSYVTNIIEDDIREHIRSRNATI